MNNKMVAMIAGPTNRKKMLNSNKISREEYEGRLEELAKTAVKYVSEINIIPDDGVPLDFSKKFKKYGGKVIGYIPKNDYILLKKYFENCDKIVKFDAGWSGLNTCLSLKGDIIIVLGMSPGTMVEIAYTKYHKKYLKKTIPVFLYKKFFKKKIDTEIAEELDISYFSNNIELEKFLLNTKKRNL